MDVREEQLWKQNCPKLVTEDGIVMDVREEQSQKQLFPKLVTEDGIVMDVKEGQPLKHQSPKLVTVKNARLYVTLAGIVTTSIAAFQHFTSLAVFVSVSNW